MPPMLTDPACRHAKPKDKPYKLADEKGMYLEVMPSGSKYWRMKYRHAGKENRLALGVYPEVSLSEARDKRDEARKQLKEGSDPSAFKKESKQAAKVATANSFEPIAREWLEHRSTSGQTDTIPTPCDGLRLMSSLKLEMPSFQN